MTVTSAICDHYCDQPSAVGSNHCNRRACHLGAGKAPELHCHSWNKLPYTSGVVRANHYSVLRHIHHWIGLYVRLGTTDNASEHSSNYDLRKIPAHLR